MLGHECCGVVDSIGPEAKEVKVGERVVVSFPIACGDCRNCRREYYSQCDKTNENTLANALYGKRTAGKLKGVVDMHLIWPRRSTNAY